MQQWFYTARQALESGVQAHPWVVVALIVAIPFIMLLSGVLGYLNVYLLQWVASRAIADMRVRLFRHLLDLSAGFYSTEFLRPAYLAGHQRYRRGAKHPEQRGFRGGARPRLVAQRSGFSACGNSPS